MAHPTDLPIRHFATSAAWEKWLAAHYEKEKGLWLRLSKKNSGERSVTYDEALDVALCYGWIDGQKQPYDDASWLQRFTPRRAKSAWSKRNTQHVQRLIKVGRMQASGLQEVTLAKKDGRWQRAYDSHSTMEIPADFLKVLEKNKKAKSFFETLNKQNLYAIVYRLQTAKKPETREKRIKMFVEMLAKSEVLHP